MPSSSEISICAFSEGRPQRHRMPGRAGALYAVKSLPELALVAGRASIDRPLAPE